MMHNTTSGTERNVCLHKNDFLSVTMLKVIPFRSQFRIQWLLLSLTCDKVAALEGKCKLLRVFVLAIPNGVSLAVKVLPEVGKGYCQCVLIRIFSLELVHDKHA